MVRTSAHGTDDTQLWASMASWLDEHVRPTAGQTDSSGELPLALVRTLGEAGFLGSMLPVAKGGAGRTHRQYAAMCEELGRACSNVRNLVAVQDMVIHAIAEWGTTTQAAMWLPRLTGGHGVAAFALTEPGIGSDAARIGTSARVTPDGYVLSGTKTWISFGQVAELLLVFAQLDGQHTAFIVEPDVSGVSVAPAGRTLGLSGSLLGRIQLDDVVVPADAIVGFPGSGMTFVAGRSLAIGRLSTAAGCVGLAQACLEASVRRSRTREQYGAPIGDQQLVKALLADMAVGTRAARLMCEAAAAAFDTQHMDADYLVLMAKYHASFVAATASRDAVQLHGASGLTDSSEVGRLFRDAKAMEIIEGTTQIIQSLVGEWTGLDAHPVRGRVAAPARPSRLP